MLQDTGLVFINLIAIFQSNAQIRVKRSKEMVLVKCDQIGPFIGR